MPLTWQIDPAAEIIIRINGFDDKQLHFNIPIERQGNTVVPWTTKREKEIE